MKSELILTHLGSEEKQKSVPDFFQAITIKPYLKEFPSRNEVLSNVLSLPAYLLYWGIDNINFLTHIIKK